MITRMHVVHLARSWVGTPYHHQASAKGIGCDCLGLVRGVYEELFGYAAESVPPYTRDWAESRGAETLLAAAGRHLVHKGDYWDARVGDVLVFRLNNGSMAKHMAIVSGNDAMVHAQEKVGCVEVSIGRWWQRRVAAVFEFPGVS